MIPINNKIKPGLIEYLLSEIDCLEPANKYYFEYYCLFTNLEIAKNNNLDYKNLFKELLNDSNIDYIINFMKNTMFLPEFCTNEEINDIICEFQKTQYENKTKSENSVIIDNYLEQEIKKNKSNNVSSNTDCIIS